MNWLYITILAYFLLSIANLGDKLVVSKYKFSPLVYAIAVALLQGLAVFLLPFFGEWPSWQNLLLNLAQGGTFIIALYFYYKSLNTGETSRVVSTIDAFVPIIILGLSFLFLQEVFDINKIIAIVFLIGGGFFLSYQNKAKSSLIFKNIIFAVLFMATSQVLAKTIYNDQPFFSAFIWARAGGFVVVFPFLFMKKVRDDLKRMFMPEKKVDSINNGGPKVVIITQISGASAFILQNYAIKLGSVSVVAALQGIKYVFLLIMILFFSKKFEQLKEDWSKRIVIQKVFGIGLVVVGFVLLVI